ncbi:hypothetical protein SESBI_30086 [Sesbania bispinosa]|nr:hypothetical protein SESBI_30086 [Sesbania bispinosa]
MEKNPFRRVDPGPNPEKWGKKAQNGRHNRHDRRKPPCRYCHNGRHMQNGGPTPYGGQTAITDRGRRRHTFMAPLWRRYNRFLITLVGKRQPN